jgi:hypothetical protein
MIHVVSFLILIYVILHFPLPHRSVISGKLERYNDKLSLENSPMGPGPRKRALYAGHRYKRERYIEVLLYNDF